MNQFTTYLCLVTLTSLLGATALFGCRSLSLRAPSDEKVIAAREMTRLGQDALMDGRLKEAEIRFTSALESCPNDIAARRHYARTLWQKGEFDQAIAEMTAATDQPCENPTWTVELGRMLFDRQQLAGAMECATRALVGDPKLPAAWKLRGDVFQQHAQLQSALEAYYKALSCGSNDSQVRLAIAEVHQKRGRPDRALSTLQRIMDSYDPGNEPPEVAVYYGVALAALNRHEDAIVALADARVGQPENPQLSLQLAKSYLALAQPEQARAEIMTALQTHPNEPELLATLNALDGTLSRIAAGASDRQLR